MVAARSDEAHGIAIADILPDCLGASETLVF
jgi:hypothetical protein